MRIKIFIKLYSEEINIPPNSRQSICHLIKCALEKSNLLLKDKLYKENINAVKPFTFSTYFPFEVNNILKKPFSIIFSSNDYEFLISIYNGLLELNKSKNKIKLFGSDWSVERFLLLPEKNISSNKVTFKTLSPFLVRDPDNGDLYLYPEGIQIQTKDEGKNGDHWPYWKKVQLADYIDALKKSLESLTNSQISSISLSKNSIVPILHGSGNQDHRFSMTFPGMKGMLEIEASPEVLKLIYDLGIGARRSEGFGMLEVVE